MNSKILIRDPLISELGSLTTLALRSKAYWPHDPDYVEQCRPYFEIKESDLPNLYVRVLLVEHELIAWAGWIPKKNYLDHLWVDPKHIGKGFGTLLWTDGIKEFKSRGIRFVEMMAERFAEGFYKKLGAVSLGLMPSRIKNGPDHIKMRFEIT